MHRAMWRRSVACRIIFRYRGLEPFWLRLNRLTGDRRCVARRASPPFARRASGDRQGAMRGIVQDARQRHAKPVTGLRCPQSAHPQRCGLLMIPGITARTAPRGVNRLRASSRFHLSQKGSR